MTTTDPQMNTSMQVKLEISKSLPSPFFKNQYAQKNKYENCKICWNMMFVSVNRNYQILPEDRWSGSPVQHVRQGNWEMQRHRHWRIHEGQFIISYLECKIFIFVNMVLPTSVQTWSWPFFIFFTVIMICIHYAPLATPRRRKLLRSFRRLCVNSVTFSLLLIKLSVTHVFQNFKANTWLQKEILNNKI